MTPVQIIFLLSAGLIVVSALLVVTTRSLVHAALWLIAALFGVAVLYALLDASFLAVVQVVVYIGAIAIMFIFAVMLTRKEILEHGPQVNSNWLIAGLFSLLTFVGLFFLLLNWNGSSRSAPVLPGGVDTLHALGLALISPDAYVLPFEVASVLLLAALVGAVYVAMNKK
jgi:NADH-quinone oxidoreductase subunit J